MDRKILPEGNLDKFGMLIRAKEEPREPHRIIMLLITSIVTAAGGK